MLPREQRSREPPGRNPSPSPDANPNTAGPATGSHSRHATLDSRRSLMPMRTRVLRGVASLLPLVAVFGVLAHPAEASSRGGILSVSVGHAERQRALAASPA